jgi:tetratricopeptide (TPR) repeat protein
LLGYSHYSLEQYPRAIDNYLKMLAEPEVDDRQKMATRYTVAQLYFIQEDYGRAARQLETWLTETPEPGSDGRMLLAQAYYYLKRQDESLRLVNQIVGEALSSGKIPKESWWSLQRVLFYERGEYQKVIASSW